MVTVPVGQQMMISPTMDGVHPLFPMTTQDYQNGSVLTPSGFYRVRGPPGAPPGFVATPAVTLESRIYEMNKRLQHRSDVRVIGKEEV